MFFLEIFLYIFNLVDAIIPENKIFVCILISFFFNNANRISSVCKNYYIINYQHNIQNKVLKSYILLRRNYYIWHSQLPNCLVSCKNFKINMYTLRNQ